jgi:hypothetical protein
VLALQSVQFQQPMQVAAVAVHNLVTGPQAQAVQVVAVQAQ